MEIILALVALGLLVWAYQAFKKPIDTPQDLTLPIPYKVEPPVEKPVEQVIVAEATPPSLTVVDTTPVIETVVVEAPVKKTRKPRTPRAVKTPEKKPTKVSAVKITKAKNTTKKSKNA